MSPEHKVLIHRPTITEKAMFPIGRLGEESQEVNNKIFKCTEKNLHVNFFHLLILYFQNISYVPQHMFQCQREIYVKIQIYITLYILNFSC